MCKSCAQGCGFTIILISDAALNLQKLLLEFVITLSLESPIALSDQYKRIKEFGWKRKGDYVEITWDENIEITRKQLNKRRPLRKVKCSCRAGKWSIESKGCKNCTKTCKPCTNAFECKTHCSNPHNNNGTCQKCSFNIKGTVSDSETGESVKDTSSSIDVTEDYVYTGKQ